MRDALAHLPAKKKKGRPRRQVRASEPFFGSPVKCMTLEGLGGRFTLVFAGVEIEFFGQALDLMSSLVEDKPELSLYFSPQGFRVLFVIRGELTNQTWACDKVLTNLQQMSNSRGAPKLAFGALDAKPRRLHWCDDVTVGRRAFRRDPITSESQLSSAYRRLGITAYNRDRLKERLFMLFIRSNKVTNDAEACRLAAIDDILKNHIKIGDAVVVRDVFELGESIQVSPSTGTGAAVWKVDPGMPAVTRIRNYLDGGVGAIIAIRSTNHYSAYVTLNDWRNNLREALKEKLDDFHPELKILPIDIVKEGSDYPITYEIWGDFLSARGVTEDKAIYFGRIAEN